MQFSQYIYSTFTGLTSVMVSAMVVANACDLVPRRGKEKDQKSRVTLSYSSNSGPAWCT